MPSSEADSSRRSDAGFFTPLFGASAIALGLIAIAGLQLASSQDVAARRDAERLQEDYRADGVAVLAAANLLQNPGDEVRRWTERTPRQVLDVLVEPEMRKLSISEAGGAKAHVRLEALLGPASADQIAVKLTQLAALGKAPPTRATLAALDASSAWRSCGLTLVSAFSRLTDNALRVGQSPPSSEPQRRAGEVWRIVVASPRRVILDRLVRFTGDARAPTAVIDELARPVRPFGCAERIHPAPEGL
jgi:hypothetical protein